MRTVGLLVCSNIFMTFAWYGHLKTLNHKPLLQFSLAQLKVLQEIITMSVFAAFATTYMRQPLSRDFLWASLCLVAAAYFMFRGAVSVVR